MPTTPTIIYRTTDALQWGDGKGANLTPGEVDQNFFNIAAAIAGVAALEPHEITSITVTANQMTVHLDGGATFGPFTLPLASLHFRDDWQPDTAYSYADLVTAAQGLYLVLLDHTSESVFDPDAGSGVGPYYQLVIPFPQIYDIGFFWPGKPGLNLDSGGTMLAHVALRSFYLPASLTGSKGNLEVDPDFDTAYTIKKNATTIGSVNFAEGETTPTFTFTDDVQFTAGDRLRVLRPTDIDTDASGLTLSFAAILGTIPEEPSSS